MTQRLILPAAIAALVLIVAAVGWGLFYRPAETALSQEQIDATMAEAESAYADTDYPRVVTLLTELADAGVPLAQYRLGLMYKEGLGVAADEAAAETRLTQAFDSGMQDARGPLGEIFATRAAAATTLEDGLPLYQRAAELGQTSAVAVLGSYYLSGTGVTQDIDRGIELLTTAAEAGDPRAQTNLGYVYATGTGVEADDAVAFRWYLEAAEAGLVRAQAAVGLFYETGRGTEIDIPEALRWYVNAYEAGSPGVGVRLGDLVTSGTIEAPMTGQVAAWVADAGRAGHDDAIAWLESAAQTGNPGVLTIIGGLYEAGEVLPQNSALALDCYQRAAEGGHADAQLALARRYATGEGVEQDYVQAHVWANLAAAAGAEGAAGEREVFAQFLTPENLAEAQTRATAWRAAHREP